jgi:hypothetical protein
MKSFFLSLATLTICASNSYAATYIEPNLEGKTLLKIDQIPLDSNTMHWIAGYLAEQAEQQAGSNDPKKLQTSAKLLALAEQLDKSLPQLTTAHLKLQQGTKSRPNRKRSQHKGKRLRSILEYLETDESNAEGKLLVQLTKDALAAIAPEKSPLAEFSVPNALWQNSIAEYDQFERSGDPKTVNSDKVKHTTPIAKTRIDPPAEKPKSPAKTADTEWKIKEFTLIAPFTTYKIVGKNNSSVHSAGLKKITVKVSPLKTKEEHNFTFRSAPTYFDKDHLAYLNYKVARPLKSQWQNIPSTKFTFQLSNAYSYRSDSDLTSSALTVAFDSALLGVPLRSDTLIIASIDGRSNFKRNYKFWRTLDFLTEKVRDTRILVGSGSEEYLLQLIALGHPEFFIQNEVIEVENLKQARKLTSNKDHESLAEATTLFAEVKSAIERKSLRSMTENKYVREKLERVLEIMPNHLSAKILLEYGSRKKPSLLGSKFYAISMKNLLDSVNRILTKNEDDYLSGRHAIILRDQISKGIQPYRDIILKEDKFVYDKIENFCDILRNFSRVRDNSNDEDRKNSSYYSKSSIRILRELKALNNEIQIDLAKLSGTPLKQE